MSANDSDNSGFEAEWEPGEEYLEEMRREAEAQQQAVEYFASTVLAAFRAAGLYTDPAIAAAGGPSSSTMTKLRKRDISTAPRGDTFERIDRAAHWVPGSSREVWAGRDPLPLGAEPPGLALRRTPYSGPTWVADIDDPWVPGLVELKRYVDDAFADDDGRLGELERRIRQLERVVGELLDAEDASGLSARPVALVANEGEEEQGPGESPESEHTD